MATKSKADKEAVAIVAAVVVSFVRKDCTVGEGDDAVDYVKGQRLDLPKDEFDDAVKSGFVERGVYARMKQSIGGKRYNLKVGDPVWLAPYVYDAWKAAGNCDASDTDPQVADDLAVALETVRALTASRAEDLETIGALRAGWSAERLAAEAVRVEAEALAVLVSVDAKPDVVKALKSLADVLPDPLVVDDAGDVSGGAGDGAGAGDDEGDAPKLKL